LTIFDNISQYYGNVSQMKQELLVLSGHGPPVQCILPFGGRPIQFSHNLFVGF